MERESVVLPDGIFCYQNWHTVCSKTLVNEKSFHCYKKSIFFNSQNLFTVKLRLGVDLATLEGGSQGRRGRQGEREREKKNTY